MEAKKSSIISINIGHELEIRQLVYDLVMLRFYYHLQLHKLNYDFVSDLRVYHLFLILFFFVRVVFFNVAKYILKTFSDLGGE
jgi:hypothetical protein